MTLFRNAALGGKDDRLDGPIILAVPMSWQLVGTFMGAAVSLALITLASLSYARTEESQGTIIPDGGIIEITPPRAGQISNVAVEEGRVVNKGSKLVQVVGAELDARGVRPDALVLAVIAHQKELSEQQGAAAYDASSAAAGGLTVQISGLNDELKALEAQIRAQRTLVQMAELDQANVKLIAERGFISKRDVAIREEQLLTRQQQMALLQQTQSAKRAELNKAISSRSESAAQARGAISRILTDRAILERDRLIATTAAGYELTSPIRGRVAAMSVHVGDTVSPSASIMAIVPLNGHYKGRMYISAKSAAFIKVGQHIRMSLTSYPADRFGTLRGTITAFSAAPVLREEKDGEKSPYYVAWASIETPYMMAYGRREPILAGMTFTATITAEKRSLMRWLFDPIYANGRS